MYKLDSHDFLKISRCYGLVGFKINNGYRFYGNLRLNHTYNNICLKNKLYIIPSFRMKAAIFLTRLVPRKLLLKITYLIQDRKTR